MKTLYHSLLYSIFLISICTIQACSKDSDSTTPDPPPPPPPKQLTVVTNKAERTFVNAYGCTGKITDDGGTTVTEYGMCWGTNANPTKADTFYANTGPDIEVTLVGLNAKQTYHVRAYAVNSTGTVYGNDVSFTTPLDIGFAYEGGIIFSYDSSYTHGLVAAPYDQGKDVPYAPGNLFATTTYANSVSNGSYNTDQILNNYGNFDRYAAKLCRDYKGGGYSDWYLPAADELSLLALRQQAVGGFPMPDQFTQYFYWSSTEYDYFRAWDVEFNTAFANSYYDQKNSNYYVRAIRAF